MKQILAQDSRFTLVGVAKDGCHALHHTLAFKPDLVLIEQNLSGLDGAQATQYIKHFPKSPVVFLVTADDSTLVQAVSKSAGADALVVKSASFRFQLKSRLQELQLSERSWRPRQQT
jgi:DNA-binding NarL/FixJ family response regulator